MATGTIKKDYHMVELQDTKNVAGVTDTTVTFNLSTLGIPSGVRPKCFAQLGHGGTRWSYLSAPSLRYVTDTDISVSFHNFDSGTYDVIVRLLVIW